MSSIKKTGIRDKMHNEIKKKLTLATDSGSQSRVDHDLLHEYLHRYQHPSCVSNNVSTVQHINYSLVLKYFRQMQFKGFLFSIRQIIPID